MHQQGPEITWRQLICNLISVEDVNILYDNLKAKIIERTGSETSVEVLEELGLLDEKTIEKCGNPLETLAHYLSVKLALGNLKKISYFYIVHVLYFREK